MTDLHPAFDWQEIARLALTSRAMDDLEENELTPQGLIVYQFSARGHELGQLLLSQLLGKALDGAGAYYRSRPFMLGCGLTVEEAFASGMTRAGGLSGGRDVGVVFNMPHRGKATILPAAGDVGAQYTPAVGWAQALRYRVDELGESEHDGSITMVFGGDGSVATNGFWSALTIATTLQLPVLFVIEDNGYAISVKGGLQTPGRNIAANLAAFNGLQIWDGSGVIPAESAELVANAVQHVRDGNGPGLLRLTVPRLAGHSSADNQAYKSETEQSAEWEHDPLPALRDYLVPTLLSADEWDALVVETAESVRKSAETAAGMPEPALETVADFTFADPLRPAMHGGVRAAGIALPPGTTMPTVIDPRRINMVQAVNRVLEVELALNPRVVVFGEDVGHKGGVHTATVGLQKKFGERRVFDTSLSEEGIIGRATGMALAGLLPVPEIQFRKYADPATEQLHNLGTLRWRSNNQFCAPVVVRVPGGFGRKIGDPWHSVTDEAMFAHAVGWQVAFPSNAADCVGLLRSALRSDNPTFFLEHRAQLDAAWARRPYPGDDYVVPFGRGNLITEGNALTVVTWGAMVERCDVAARDLDGVEIIDLRTIMPWDKEMVLNSVRKTSKCLVVHEDIGVAGFGAEVVATIVAEAFMDLDAPVERLAAPAVPIPFNINLMHAVVPSIEVIRAKMAELLAF
ncbi:MAG: thiamine pyrophosphate-dependent enzyme [Anaerolineae bacterium]|nr:thiamine pyrophosphate-dependent enzyme [Anaerolineae bacterium]